MTTVLKHICGLGFPANVCNSWTNPHETKPDLNFSVLPLSTFQFFLIKMFKSNYKSKKGQDHLEMFLKKCLSHRLVLTLALQLKL